MSQQLYCKLKKIFQIEKKLGKLLQTEALFTNSGIKVYNYDLLESCNNDKWPLLCTEFMAERPSHNIKASKMLLNP